MRHEPRPDFSREAVLLARGLGPVAGVDEVGRGPLAGPVVVAAVILDPAAVPPGLADSKLLDAGARETAFSAIMRDALAVAIATRDAGAIDRGDIRRAALEAMAEAVLALCPAARHVLVDGRDRPPLTLPVTTIVGGDALVASIAAASIVAKVIRDAMMDRAAAFWPAYGFERHKGYATALHRASIAAHGPCPLHRRSFRPFRPEEPAFDQTAATSLGL